MKIEIANKHTHLIDEKLGISSTRRDEIFAFIEKQYNDVKRVGIGVSLVDYYVKIADFSNNLAEYTFCMHIFIFNLSSIGEPIDSNKVKN